MKAASDLAVDAGKKLSDAGIQAADFISNVTSSARESAESAKRAARKAWVATEDMVDDTAHTIKKHPFRSVGITFGVGLGAGVLLGWFARRK